MRGDCHCAAWQLSLIAKVLSFCLTATPLVNNTDVIAMKTFLTSAAMLIGLCCTTVAFAGISDVPSGRYELDPDHGYISFTYSHLGFSHPHVGFRKFEVDLTLDADNPNNSKLVVTIDASSIDSRSDEFNDHLNGEDFFDTKKFPTITFEATNINASGDKGTITGNLTIKGITKPVTLEVIINKAANHPMRKIPNIGLSATATVDRTDFGLDSAVPFVGSEITIHIDVELPKVN